MARKRTAVVRRSGTNPTVVKLKAQAAARNTRARMRSREMLADVSAVGGGAVMGWLDTQEWAQKIDLIPGMDDAFVWGIGSYLIGANVSGKMGGVLKGAGVGMLACAARDFVNGDAK